MPLVTTSPSTDEETKIQEDELHPQKEDLQPNEEPFLLIDRDDNVSSTPVVNCEESRRSSSSSVATSLEEVRQTSTAEVTLGHLHNNDLALTVRTVYDLLADYHSGCGAYKHTQDLMLHNARGGDHHGLSATYSAERLATSRGVPEIGLGAGEIPPARGHPRHQYPPPSTFAQLFEGISAPGQPIRQICLHTQRVFSSAATVSFDIDSFIGFPRTLGALRRGFRWCPAKHMSFKIRNNLHVKRRVSVEGPEGRPVQRTVHLRDIPHLYLGAVDGLFQCALYVFFPRLMKLDTTFSYLEDAVVRRFVDDAMIPCCQQFLQLDQLQHLPPSQQIAELKARAKGREQQQDRGERGLKNYTTYALQCHGLTETWEAMQRRFSEPRYNLEDFQDAFLFVDAKNLKMDFKMHAHLSQVIQRYEEHLRTIFHFDLMDAMIHDVAREICPERPAWTITPQLDEAEATVYLWKTCCLKSLHQKLQRGPFNGRPGQMSLYHSGFLRDASSMTIEPPVRSQVYRGGLLYAQWYPSVKEMTDANATYPFLHDGLTELAINPRVWASYVRRHKRSSLHRREFLDRSYAESKVRVRESYRESERVSFGQRVECRVTHAVLESLQQLARSVESQALPSLRLDQPPSTVWAIPTIQWSRFMLGNYEKLTAALEIVAITSPPTGVGLERSKLMATLIRCVQLLPNCDPARDAILWCSVQDTPSGRRRGLGFEESIARYGYGWFASVIDWERLTFLSTLSSEVVQANHHLGRWYQGSGRLIHDANALLDVCLPYLSSPTTTRTVYDEVVLISIHLCLREYRRDILAILRKELRDASDEDFDIDDIRFCYDTLIQVFRDQPSLVSGNKSLAAQPSDMFEWIWGDSSLYCRRFFQEKSFRLMARKIQEALCEVRVEMRVAWKAQLQAQLFRHHWLLPYPDTNGTLISTAKATRARRWWSVIQGPTSTEHSWGRNKWQSGLPPPYPRALELSVEDLQVHFQRLSESS